MQKNIDCKILKKNSKKTLCHSEKNTYFCKDK